MPSWIARKTVAIACATLTGFAFMQEQSLTQGALDQELRIEFESATAALEFPFGANETGPYGAAGGRL